MIVIKLNIWNGVEGKYKLIEREYIYKKNVNYYDWKKKKKLIFRKEVKRKLFPSN